MEKKTGFAAVLIVVAFALVTACAEEQTAEAGSDPDRPVVAATFTVFADFVQAVSGDQAEVRRLTPAGAEVHEYELGPRNFVDLEEADIVFYNGYDIEQWMPQVRETVKDGVRVIPVAEQTEFPTIPLQLGEFEGAADPHLWMAPRGGIAYVEVMRHALVEDVRG